MVQAILDGRKTQTRRVVKPQPLTHGRTDSRVRIYQRGEKWEVADTFSNDGFSCLDSFKCPYGQPGDVLWVREEHYMFGHWEHDLVSERKTCRQAWMFLPDSNEVRFFDNPPMACRNTKEKKVKFKQEWNKRLARYMPKAACRIFLQVKSLRVERLQDISENDAVAEGIEPVDSMLYPPHEYGFRFKNYLQNSNSICLPKASFMTLWQSINGPESWDANPWVWVVEFERIEKPTGWPF